MRTLSARGSLSGGGQPPRSMCLQRSGSPRFKARRSPWMLPNVRRWIVLVKLEISWRVRERSKPGSCARLRVTPGVAGAVRMTPQSWMRIGNCCSVTAHESAGPGCLWIRRIDKAACQSPTSQQGRSAPRGAQSRNGIGSTVSSPSSERDIIEPKPTSGRGRTPRRVDQSEASSRRLHGRFRFAHHSNVVMRARDAHEAAYLRLDELRQPIGAGKACPYVPSKGTPQFHTPPPAFGRRLHVNRPHPGQVGQRMLHGVGDVRGHL